MSAQERDHRAAILGCGALALLTMMGDGTALAQSRAAIGAIRVDVAPLRAAAGDPTATWVEQELPRQLAEALSGSVTANGAPLIVRIDSLTIGPNKDSRAWDNISGVATIGGVERPVRATSRYWASAVDQPAFVQSNHARVSAATQALAFWIARDR
jgi:predicted NBD/HSP70 family sugar kinase